MIDFLLIMLGLVIIFVILMIILVYRWNKELAAFKTNRKLPKRLKNKIKLMK